MSQSNKSNWLISLAYSGTGYSGWQVQPGRLSVQGVVQEKLSTLFQLELRLAGCSRTDAGVHALAQKASFHPPEKPPIDEISAQRALNSLLPKDIRILRIDKVPANFHARHDAIGKAYTYLLYTEDLFSPFFQNFFWTMKCKLDIQAMIAAARTMIGTHDFTGFSVNNCISDTQPVKTLFNVTVKKMGTFIVISVVGDSFLYKMVRRIVGFLVKVGKGQVPPAVASQILNAKNRVVQFDTAPAQGLFLEEVFYRKEEISEFQSRQIPFLKLLGLPGEDLYSGQ